MKLLRTTTLLACALLAAICTPTMASCQGHYENGVWHLSNTVISGTFVNNTADDVTFSNVRWNGRYGIAHSDGVITDRIQGTVAPGKSISSYHRMGDLDLGERYTELSFDATFTRKKDGSTGTCYFWYSYKTETETRAGSAASPGGSNKDHPASCELKFNSYYDVTFTISDPNPT